MGIEKFICIHFLQLEDEGGWVACVKQLNNCEYKHFKRESLWIDILRLIFLFFFFKEKEKWKTNKQTNKFCAQIV